MEGEQQPDEEYGGENRQGAFVEVDEEDPFVGLQLRVLADDGTGFIACGIELSEPGRYELRKADEPDFEAFEEKMDELNDGLLSAYAAGFQKALEIYDIHPDMETDLKSLKNHRALSEDHYYFWDGRTKPLEFWLREQFGLDDYELPEDVQEEAEELLEAMEDDGDE